MLVILIIIVVIAVSVVMNKKYKELEQAALKELGFSGWDIVPYIDRYATVKSRRALEKYDEIKYFKENSGELENAEKIIKKKDEVSKTLKKFLNGNSYESDFQYKKLLISVNQLLTNASAYRVRVSYISSAGNKLGERERTSLQQWDAQTVPEMQGHPSCITQ